VKRSAFFTFLAVAAFVASTFLGSSAAAGKARKKSRKAKPAAVINFDTKLPVLGTRLADLPPGPGKAVADQACLFCHSSDMVWQQRLTEKQWTAEINKMIGWGAEVPEAKKDALLAYLVANFGPDNEKFQPLATRPVGK
jgi:quinoprotein glucose dehydrogenase